MRAGKSLMSPAMAGASRRRVRGFTLLEAIVALTVFSICAMALYGWLAVNLDALVRVEASAGSVRDGRAALAMLETVDPMAEPKGQRELPGELVIRWTSEEIGKRAPGAGPSGSVLIFDLALYDMHVEVLRAGREVRRFDVRRTGWETVRSLHDEEF